MSSLSVSAFIDTLLDDLTQAAAQTTLGLGTGDSPTLTGLTLSGTLSCGGVTCAAIDNGNSNFRTGGIVHIDGAGSALGVAGSVSFNEPADAGIWSDGTSLVLDGSIGVQLNVAGSSTGYLSATKFNINSGLTYTIANTTVLSATALGTGVLASSLTSVGTLTGLTVSGSGNATITQSGAAAATPVLVLNQVDIDDTFLNFIGTTAADGTRSISSDTTEDAAKFGAYRVEINGVTKWVRVYDDES